MGGVDDDAANQRGAATDLPLTVELLADLQAGLLDDATATRVRERVRADPDAERVLRALERVRSEVAALRATSAPAPATPLSVVAGVLRAALRSRPAAGSRDPGRPAHSARPAGHSGRVIGAVVGLAAAAAAVGLGTAALVGESAPTPTAPTTIEHITVSSSPEPIPLSDPEILALLDISPDYGQLSDPRRLASCLSGFDYPASTRILGARPIEMNGRPGVLLLLSSEHPGTVQALVVAPNCSSLDTGLLAHTLVKRP